MNTLILLSLFAALYLIVWFAGWLILDKHGNVNSKISFILKWYDGWIGFFWDSKKKWLYVFPLPFFGIIIKPYRNNFS